MAARKGSKERKNDPQGVRSARDRDKSHKDTKVIRKSTGGEAKDDIF
ncbi:hypothetical protein OROGR_016693 [Orobanche gracilis]